MTEIPFISSEEIIPLMPVSEAVDLAERALLIHKKGECLVAPRTRMALPPPVDDPGLAGNRMLVQYCYIKREAGEFLITKVSMDAPNNPSRHGLPSVSGIIHCIDPETGFPMAMLDSTYISALRTGGHGALGVKYLSRTDSKTVAVMGSGVQARMGLRLVKVVRPGIEVVRVYSPNRAHRESYAREMTEAVGTKVVPCETPREAVREADIIYCATYSNAPTFQPEWVARVVHISAVGTYGEIDPEVYRNARVVVHDREASKVDGHISMFLKNGALNESDVDAEIGEVILKEKPGRSSADETTVYVATGLAVLDAVFARRALEIVAKTGAAQRVRYQAFSAFQ